MAASMTRTIKESPSSLIEQSARREWLAYTALALAVAGTSWTAIFVRWAGISGTAAGFYRVSIAAVILVPCWIFRAFRNATRQLPVVDAPIVRMAMVGGFFFACDLALFNAGILRTRAATAVLLANVAPVLVGLATWLLFRRRPHNSFWFGLALAMAGSAIITIGDAARAPLTAMTSSGSLKGDLLALSASVFWGAYLLTTQHVRTRADTLTFNTFAMAGSVLTLFFACIALGEPLWGYSYRTWLVLAGLGLISQLGAYLALTYALGHLPATVTSVALLGQIPLAALLGVPLLKEPITTMQLVGGAFVLGGVLLVKREKA
jgi:drug/metabolite transporter (DMT)-like permease